MELAAITFKQVGVLFLLILAGYVCVRTGAVHKEDKSAFSDLLINLVLPAMVLNSYFTEYDSATGRNLILTFGLSLFAIMMGLAVTVPIIRRGEKDSVGIQRFACVFSNAGYMGFPLIEALFGAEGMIYASAYVTMFNLTAWTVGIALVSRKTNGRSIATSILKTPVIYAVAAGIFVYFLQIPVPELLQKPISMIGSMNTPLSMFITGMLIASSRLDRIIRRRELWVVTFVRMLLIPAICTGVFALLGFRGMPAQVVLLLEACPSAAMTCIVAVRYRCDEEFSAGMVVVTTLISILTLPVLATLLGSLI